MSGRNGNRPRIAAALLAMASSLGWGTATLASPVDAWAWKHRLLVVFAPAETHEALADQRRMLARVGAGLGDRHMAVVEVIDGKVSTAFGPDLNLTGRALKSHAGKADQRFEVMLFGKDTGLKLRSKAPVSANELFSLIDTMPMRRREMRQAG